MAEHGMPRIGTLALDGVEHAMSETLPARQVDREGRAADQRSACGAPQHFLLRGRKVLADPDLANDAGADFRVVLGHAAIGRDRRGDGFDRHVSNVGRMRGLEVEARAHHDVEAGAAADALERGGVAADAQIGRIDHGLPAIFDEFPEFLDRGLHIHQATIVAIEERVHPEFADHRDIQRPLGEGDLGGAARPLPPARSVEQDVLVHERHPHGLDGDGPEDCANLSGPDAGIGLGHRRKLLASQTGRRPLRNRRKFSQIATRMMTPSTIGVRKGER